MKKTLFCMILLCLVPFVCLAELGDSFSPVEIGSCQVFLHDDWGFLEYTEEFDRLSPYDRMFFNMEQDIIMLSVLSYAENLPHETPVQLFETANSLMKNFQSDNSIVTLGQVDNHPRLTITDETEAESKTQWFVFSGEDVVYIGIYSPDKYRVRTYNSCLHYIQVQ